MSAALAQAWWLAPMAALLLGVLALGPLGEQVLARGVVFIDLAVAQAAAAAALWAGALIDHPSTLQTQVLAATGALACAAAVALLARRWPAQREALIGLLYVAGASVALLGARQDPHGRERMAELLAADVLWAAWPQVALLLAAALAVMLLVALPVRMLTRDGVFFTCFALVASLSVPVLGLLLVFAMLIVPALLRRAGLGAAGSTGLALGTAGLGLGASWLFDAPSGACIVLALSAAGLLASLRHRPAG